ncbi:hypothetical protein OBBRIDRAFT_891191 [Obba rivulosa]|uniref:Protein kinase domain-containing protein n=1 Tax=Obba rivulosa TaxID=1052685 RepID=A0A8E2AIY3_9APHY|nr:hypothetical protein OBBRIDRAFT_891191 [Obba rivulosa]
MALHLPSSVLHRSLRTKGVDHFTLHRTVSSANKMGIYLPADLSLLDQDTSEPIYHSEDSNPAICTKVYRVNIGTDNGAELSVVCKIVTGRDRVVDLQTETGHYAGHLKDLQGECVPVFLGLYEGMAGVKDQQHVGCLITMFSGAPVKNDDWPHDLDLAVRIGIALKHIHYAGLQLVVLDSQNFLMDSRRRVFIVDFASATLHTCKFKHEITYTIPRPYTRLDICPELERVCIWARIYPPMDLVVGGQWFCMPISAEEIANTLSKRYALMSYEKAFIDATNELEDVREGWRRRGVKFPAEWKEMLGATIND